MLRLKACIFKFKAYPRKLSTGKELAASILKFIGSVLKKIIFFIVYKIGTPRPCNPSGNKPEKSESDRIKTFHDKLKLEKLPSMCRN